MEKALLLDQVYLVYPVNMIEEVLYCFLNRCFFYQLS